MNTTQKNSITTIKIGGNIFRRGDTILLTEKDVDGRKFNDTERYVVTDFTDNEVTLSQEVRKSGLYTNKTWRGPISHINKFYYVELLPDARNAGNTEKTVDVPCFSRWNDRNPINRDNNPKMVDPVKAFENLLNAFSELNAFSGLPLIRRNSEVKNVEPVDEKSKTNKNEKTRIVGKIQMPGSANPLPVFTFESPYILPKYFSNEVYSMLGKRWVQMRDGDAWYPFVYNDTKYLAKFNYDDNTITVKTKIFGKTLTTSAKPINGDKFCFEDGLKVCMTKIAAAIIVWQMSEIRKNLTIFNGNSNFEKFDNLLNMGSSIVSKSY